MSGEKPAERIARNLPLLYFNAKGKDWLCEKSACSAVVGCFVDRKAGPRHKSNAPGLAEGESMAIVRMLKRDRQMARD
jgi:hypothetical protein